MTLREQFYAELYRGYLSLTLVQLNALHAFTLTTGAQWPANADVKRLCPHDDAPSTVPCIAIVATESPTKHPLLLSMDVFVRLQIQSQLKDGDPVPEGEEDPVDRAGTAMPDAQAWLQAINEALLATETFRAHLLTLSQAERTGGEMMLRMVDSGIPHVQDPSNRTHTWEIKIAHKVDVYPADD